jgi:hypothetical protein
LAPGEKQPIAKAIWQDYEAYHAKLHGTGRGAFAVSVDGNADGYSWCPDGADGCIAGKTYEGVALDGCRHSGLVCRLFDERGTIVVPYEIEE